ncbi:MAG: SpoIIE family protein phosphatase [candidate division KSB1 bacterium]|nr:SpoIIE family protein phosphatase [candidate division KSB1 bacterium]MDZ7319481.1 SpoIIE family protein phosphatase [candidate division KSB1 bacterium]MDZ7340518.1 SpoIIE family protein phosphatase [candidate division KSB1 bacterium]
MFKAAINEEIKVPARIEYLGDLRNFIVKAGRKHNFDSNFVYAFKLCVDEAATNIIKHAYRDTEGMITLRVIIKKNSMTVALIDQGKYFDPHQVSDPDLQRYVAIGKKGGLGIHIMRKLIDEIEYHRTEEGNELRLTKYRHRVVAPKQEKKKAPGVPYLSRALKTKYSIYTMASLTAVVLIVYMYYFFSHGSSIFNAFAKTQSTNCESMSRLVWGENDTDFNHINIATNIAQFIQDRPEVHKIIVTSLNNFVEYSTDEKLAFTEFKIPPQVDQPRPGMMLFKDENQEPVYAFYSDVYSDQIEKKDKVGSIYLLVKKSYLDHQIARQRLKDLQVALLVLLASYAGVAVLIYFVLNPFRKLANWVKELGSGNVQDEIDFDSSTEAGEIAQAFSEITDKFRESQKNLAEQERIKKEMQVAQEIQQTLLPSEIPVLEGYEIGSYYEAAWQVGGDYYDFVDVDKDMLGIVVADVSGKGLPGAMIMTMIRTLLRTEARAIRSSSEVLARLNNVVVDDMKKGMFVTLFYVIVDAKKRRINYASAGHNPMILYRRSTQKTYYLNPRGFPVGISLSDRDLFKNSIESDTIQLGEDDLLILYTDGITEAMNHRREMFGEERMLEVIRKYGDLTATEFAEKLMNEIHSFTEGYPQNDDITFVVIKEKSTPEKIELTRAQKAHQMVLKGKSIRDACEEAGITTYAYYNKYKKIFEEGGLDAYSIDETVSVEAKHLSIEEKTKIYDIIQKHPEYGAKRISEELNTETYGFLEINESRIYDELVRSRLNTKQLREAFIARGGKRKRLKPPGTPMLMLDGKVILDDRMRSLMPEPETQPRVIKLKTDSPEVEKATPSPRKIAAIPKEPDDNFYLESMMTMPLEELLKKKRQPAEPEATVPAEEESPVEKEATPVEPAPEFEPAAPPVPEEVTAEDLLFESEPSAKETPPSEELPAATEPALPQIEFLDEVPAQTDEPSPEDVGLEHDFSFRDIWDEQATELNIESELEIEEPATSAAPTPEATAMQGHDQQAAAAPDALEFPEAVEDKSGVGFEMLTEGTSFRDEIFKTAAEDAEQVDNEADDTSTVADDTKAEQAAQTDSAHEVSSSENDIVNELPDDAARAENIITVDADAILAKELTSDVDFSFDDLLNEIEKDVTFLSHQAADEEEADLVFQEHERKEAVADGQPRPFKGSVTTSASETATRSEPHIKTVHPSREKNFLLGVQYYHEKEFQEAIKHFKMVTLKHPDFKEAFSLLGNAYYRSGQIDLAIQSYQRVKELDPFDVVAYENIGVIYANRGDYEDAVKEWQTLLEIKPQRQDIAMKIKRAQVMIRQR